MAEDPSREPGKPVSAVDVPKRCGARAGSIIEPARAAARDETRFTASSLRFSTGPQGGPRSAGYLNDHCRAPRLQCSRRKHATDRTIGRNAGNPSPSAAESVIASSSRAAMSGSRARHQQWSRAFLMGWRVWARSIQHRTALVQQGHWDRPPRPLWGADIPRKAGSTHRNSSSPMRACASSIPSPRTRLRRRVTSRRAGCQRHHACRACTSCKSRLGVDFFARCG